MEKTFAVRELLCALRWLLFVFGVLYLGFFFFYAGYKKLGGALAHESPYAQDVPEKCKAQLEAPRDIWQVGRDDFLLQPRTAVHPVSALSGDSADCLGWAVLTATHGTPGVESNSGSSFRKIYIDERGEVVTTVTVEYEKNPIRA